MHELDQYRSDAMDSLMTIEALSHEALCSALHRYFVSEGNLVLDHDVQHRVQLFIREPNTGTAVIVLHKTNALCFIERKPLMRLRCLKGIVLYPAFHQLTLVPDRIFGGEILVVPATGDKAANACAWGRFTTCWRTILILPPHERQPRG